MYPYMVCVGDSITDANHFWSKDHPSLGDGYVYFLSQHLNSVYQHLSCPKSAPLIINKGYDGLTAHALLERLRNGSITIPKCEYLLLLIGINDIAVSQNTGLSLKEQNFSQTYDSILKILLSKTNHLLCLGPFVFSRPALYQSWLSDVSQANTEIKKLADIYQLPFLSLQSFFSTLESFYSVDELTTDGIHLSSFSHRLLAHIIAQMLL